MAVTFDLPIAVPSNPATGATSGQTFNAYKASRFASPPNTNDPAPGGGADYGPITSDATFFVNGVHFTVNTFELFYVSYYDPADTSNGGTYNVYWVQ